MKRIWLLILLFPFLASGQIQSHVFFDSNINYAPIGLKIELSKPDRSLNYFATAKISEDILLRYVDGDSEEWNGNDNFDINETILAGGITYRFSENISFFSGLGVMGGRKFITYQHYYSADDWIPTSSWSVMPLLSFGIVLSKNDFKISIGNETAFATEKGYPVVNLNNKSFSRLSGFTIGVGYLFEK